MPSAIMSRGQASDVLDQIADSPGSYLAEMESAATSALPECKMVLSAKLDKEVYRVSARTEVLAFPELQFSGCGLTFNARTCLTACGSRVGKPRHHKIWHRLSLAEFAHTPPAAMKLGELKQFYDCASRMTDSVIDVVWPRYVDHTRRSLESVNFVPASTLEVRFFDSSSEKVQIVDDKLDQGATVSEIVHEEAGLGTFADLIEIDRHVAAGHDSRLPDAEHVLKALAGPDLSVYKYKNPFLSNSTLCLERSAGLTTSIVGVGYEVKQRERGLAFEASRTLTALRGSLM